MTYLFGRYSALQTMLHFDSCTIQYLAHINTDFVNRGATDGPPSYQQAEVLCTIKMHSVFVNTGIAMEIHQFNLSPWTPLCL